MNSLVKQLIEEECTADVRHRLGGAIADPSVPTRRFEFNRFEVTIDHGAGTAVVEDVLDASDAGRARVPLAEFAMALAGAGLPPRIRLELEPDLRVFDADRRVGTQADSAVVETTLFEMPVRFQIDGRSLFQCPDGWYPLPIIGLAVHLREAVDRVLRRSAKTAKCSIGALGTLELSLSEDRVTLALSEGGVWVVPAGELMEAVQRFAQDVAAAIATHAPELRAHPLWSHWFPR